MRIITVTGLGLEMKPDLAEATQASPSVPNFNGCDLELVNCLMHLQQNLDMLRHMLSKRRNDLSENSNSNSLKHRCFLRKKDYLS